MDAFIFQAALICSGCSATVKQRESMQANATETDSDLFPQGPYEDGGGEADTPQHCDICGLFLENELTDDGLRYVQAARESTVSEMWREFYGVDRRAA